jgi:hypothetical protein
MSIMLSFVNDESVYSSTPLKTEAQRPDGKFDKKKQGDKLAPKQPPFRAAVSLDYIFEFGLPRIRQIVGNKPFSQKIRSIRHFAIVTFPDLTVFSQRKFLRQAVASAANEMAHNKGP